MGYFVKQWAKLIACCGLCCPTVQAVENALENTELCSYVYEFNFHDPIMRQKAVRQAIKTMLFSNEISKDLGEPLHFVLPKSLYTQERNLFLGTLEHYLEQVADVNLPINIRLYFEQDELHQKVANRLIRMLSQSELFRVSIQPKRADFQLAQASYCNNVPEQILSRFHSQSPDNRQGYANPQIDDWLEKLAQPRLKPDMRERLIIQIVSQLESDIAVLPLFQYQRTMRTELK